MIYDRSIFDAVYRATVPWGHDVCRTANYCTYSYVTEDRAMIDDIHEVDGKFYHEVNGIVSEGFESREACESNAVELLSPVAHAMIVRQIEEMETW